MDYDSGPYSVMIPAGETTVSLSIAIINDNILENQEQFTLSINKSSLTSHVMLGNRGETTVIIIMDDDGIYYIINVLH